MHQFRQEIAAGFKAVEERLVAIEAAAAARAGERQRSAAKGGDFEDLLENMLAEVARGNGDLLDATADDIGHSVRSKKGDFVLTLNPDVARAGDLRIVVEAKDRRMSAREMRDELREAKANRCAAVALAVFTPAHAPAGVAPFDMKAGDVYCVIDPAAPEPATLEAAVRLARLLAMATLVESDVDVDIAAIGSALNGIRQELDAIKGLKAQLTSISGASAAVAAGLERMREGVIARVASAEAELAATAPVATT
jgi:hypothetical protein